MTAVIRVFQEIILNRDNKYIINEGETALVTCNGDCPEAESFLFLNPCA